MSETRTAAAAGIQNIEAYEYINGKMEHSAAHWSSVFAGCQMAIACWALGWTGRLTVTVPEIANVKSATGIDLTDSLAEFVDRRHTNPRISFLAGRYPMM